MNDAEHEGRNMRNTNFLKFVTNRLVFHFFFQTKDTSFCLSRLLLSFPSISSNYSNDIKENHMLDFEMIFFPFCRHDFRLHEYLKYVLSSSIIDR